MKIILSILILFFIEFSAFAEAEISNTLSNGFLSRILFLIVLAVLSINSFFYWLEDKKKSDT